MIRNKCAICNNKLNHIYKLQNVPLSVSCTENPVLNNDEMSYSICDICSTIQLDKLIPLNILYNESHNFISVGNIWIKYFILFVEKIQPIIIDKIVMEVGCPSGKIANLCKNYKKWYAIEPNINTSYYKDKTTIFINKYFDEDITNHVKEKIDIIIHSHLFEHIYEPNIFLRECYKLLNKEGEMFFGVPNMQFIADNSIAPFFGVFFEHTIFYNKENIIYLLQINNFELINIYVYENHSIFFHVKKLQHINTEIITVPRINNLCNFNINIKIYNEFIVNSIKKLMLIKNKKIYIFGASYYTQILLSIGFSNIKITGILDNCIEKHNKYLYGYNLLINSPKILEKEDCVIILKNGIYCDEIYSQIMIINPNTYIIR